MPTIGDLNVIYLLRNKLFTTRFFLLFISIVTIPLYGLFSFKIFESYYMYSILFLLFSFLWSILFVRFNQKINFSKEIILKNDFIKSYYILNTLENETLWESEQIILDLNKAHLFFHVGNYRRFLSLMDNLSHKIDKVPSEKYYYRLLKAFYFEILNDWENAIKELELISENTNNIYIKSQAFNNIGRIEYIKSNNISGESFYLKAFNNAKSELTVKHISIYIHNLLISYAKNNKNTEAKALIKEYWNLVDKNNKEDLVEYANNITHYARQINDEILLKESYKILKNLKPSEQFALDVHELRMRYNDNNSFEEHYKKTIIKIKDFKDNYSLREKLFIIKELRHVMSQYLQNKPNKLNMRNDLQWLVDWHLSLKADIKNQLNDIESSLSGIKVGLLNDLMFLEKSSITFTNKDYLPHLQQSIKYNDEIISIWKTSQNPLEHINALIHILDEINSLLEQTRDIRLISLYANKVSDNFNSLNNLLKDNWTRPGSESFMIAVAWFSMKIKNDKNLAKIWVDRFDNSNCSINHGAEFTRKQYELIKIWLSSNNKNITLI